MVEDDGDGLIRKQKPMLWLKNRHCERVEDWREFELDSRLRKARAS